MNRLVRLFFLDFKLLTKNKQFYFKLLLFPTALIFILGTVFGNSNTEITSFDVAFYNADIANGNASLKKIQKRLGDVLLVFLPNDLTCCIVHRSQQFHAPMLARGSNHMLFSAKKTCFLNSLVVPNHGFIFKQQVIDFIVQESFFNSGKVCSEN